MKKYIIKIISAFLSIILIFCALPISSDAYLNDFKADDYKSYHNLPELPRFKYGDFEVEYGIDGLTIVNYPDNKTEKVDIPEEINGIPVTEIHDTDVYTDELTIPDSVKRIRDFEPRAKKINIGNNVEIIEGVDLDCVCCNISELIFPESLKELYIDNTPSGNDSPLKKIVFKGKYQSLSFDYHKYGASNSIKPLAFPDETEIIFEGLPSYDIWYYLTYAGYKLIRNDGEFRFVKYENEQLKTCGDYQYYLDENGDAVISGYIGNESATLSIPAMLDGHKVIKIGDNTFDNRAEIPLEPLKEAAVKESGFAFNEVTIPSTVVEIGNFAFSYCRDLQKVNIPDSVETIGYSAFENCDRLTNVNLPKNLKTICGAAFTHCNLTTVTIPEGTEYIGSYAFYKNFTSEIILADSIEFIGDRVFSNAKITQISMPSSLKCIGKGAFYDCLDLESIILNSGLKEIGNGAFEFSKIKEITIPSSVELIGNHAFFRCDRLRNVVFDDNSKLKAIDEYAFAFTRIQEIIIPNSVDYLGPSCFYDVTFLKKIIISDNIKIISEHCFRECTQLSEIELPDSLVYMGEKCLAVTKIESIILPKDLKFIGAFAFEECDNLKNVTINSVSCEAEYGVWYNYENYDLKDFRDNKKTELDSVTIGDNVEYLGQYLFSGMKVPTLSLNQNIKSIHAKSFEDASVGEFYYNVPECEIIDQRNIFIRFNSRSDGISIPVSAFRNVEIEQLVLGEAMTYIPDGFLCYAEHIKSVTIPQTIQRIENGAFYHCYSLGKITIPDSVEYVGTYSFADCLYLNTVNMSERVSKIEDYSFYGCISLADFNWMSATKEIGIDSFKGCHYLKNFDFENTKFTKGSFSEVAVEKLRFGLDENSGKEISIPEGSFQACKSLDMVALGENVSSINSKAFAECENLETAIIADSVKEIADDAFAGCNNLTIYCNEDSYAQQYATENKIKVSTLIIDNVPNQTYTGKEIKPKLNVRYSGNLLTEEIDFSTQYYNNINVGTANAVVSGKGDLRMLVSKVDYAIVAVDISKTQIKNISDQHLSSSPCTPKLKISYNGNELKEDIDYTVSYQNNTQPGNATAKVKGIGNYKGEQAVSFTIVPESSFVTFFKTVWNYIVKLFHLIFK